MTKKTYDAVVVGAGVFGVWTAYHLQRSGRSVLLLDSFGAANARSSSGDESRVIRMGYGSDELYTHYALRSLSIWQELFAVRSCQDLFQRTGLLCMGKKNDLYMLETKRVLKSANLRIEEFHADELPRRYPQFNARDIEWATLEVDSGVLLASRAVNAVLDRYKAIGGEYLVERVVAPRRIRKLKSIRTEHHDQMAAAIFVFACGPWLPKLFPELLGERLFITRQLACYFESFEEPLYQSDRLPVWAHQDDEYYGLPDLNHHGVKVAWDRRGSPFDPDTGNRSVEEQELVAMRAYLSRRVPALAQRPVLDGRVCQYENTSNGDFLIDKHPEADNVWLLGGGSGHGFKHGPRIGEYLMHQFDLSEKPEPRFSLSSKRTVQNRSVF